MPLFRPFRPLYHALKTLEGKVDAMALTLDDLLAKVTALQTADDSLITLAGGLAAQLREIAGEPEKIQALADQLDAEALKVSAAVTANTIPAPDPHAVPPLPNPAG